MSFISYSQNFEDVMLWRALQHVERGFYIDVGANDPTIDSVTKAFYEAGWHGINIEPLLSHHADLVLDRPNDINLICAAGAALGEIELWECDVRGWATAKEEVIAQHSSVGHQGTLRRVPMRTLADICAEFVKEDIHFLKIDVEGFEQDVLEGADFLRFRPWIVVIESTAPNSTIEVHDQWKSLLLKANYQLAYADGLNRYYVALEHAELLVSLRYPPNVFDNFTVFSHAKALTAAQQASERAVNAASALTAVHNSSSWRLTAPLRMASRAVSAFSQGPKALKLAIKTKSKLLLAHASLYVNRRPKLRHTALVALAQFPTLKARLRVATMNSSFAQRAKPAVSTDLADLTPRARQIYADLKDAIDRRQKENG